MKYTETEIEGVWLIEIQFQGVLSQNRSRRQKRQYHKCDQHHFSTHQ